MEKNNEFQIIMLFSFIINTLSINVNRLNTYFIYIIIIKLIIIILYKYITNNDIILIIKNFVLLISI